MLDEEDLDLIGETHPDYQRRQEAQQVSFILYRRYLHQLSPSCYVYQDQHHYFHQHGQHNS